MATNRKAARRTTARRIAGKLKRSPKHGTVRAGAARPSTQRGAQRKPGTLSGRSRKQRRAAAPVRSKAERRRRALEMFGDRLLEQVEGRQPRGEREREGAEDVGTAPQDAPTYYTGRHPPSVAEPGPASTSRKGTLH